MAILTVQTSRANMSPTFSAANVGGDSFPNDGGVYLLVQAPEPGPVAFIVRSPYGGRVDSTQSHAGTSFFTPRFDPYWWNDENGHLNFEFDDPAGVSVAAIRVPVVLADPTAPAEPGLF